MKVKYLLRIFNKTKSLWLELVDKGESDIYVRVHSDTSSPAHSIKQTTRARCMVVSRQKASNIRLPRKNCCTAAGSAKPVQTNNTAVQTKKC